MLEKGLRVIELCPAIVIGQAGTGNNYGDTKVVNAPINLFGRAHQAVAEETQHGWVDRSKAVMLAKAACVFPADPTAKLNLIPVDWVVSGIIAALHKPNAVGERIHLATDKRITPADMQKILEEELEVEVKLAEPTLHRNVTLPVLTKLLSQLNQPRIADALERLSTIFGSYSEWGQPVHEVGKDVSVLGLSEPRPDTVAAFRMLCRHNRYIQDYGQIRDLAEISRREKLWTEFIKTLEAQTGQPASAISAEAFRTALADYFDLTSFTKR
jgi:hypothetical protein